MCPSSATVTFYKTQSHTYTGQMLDALDYQHYHVHHSVTFVFLVKIALWLKVKKHFMEIFNVPRY